MNPKRTIGNKPNLSKSNGNQVVRTSGGLNFRNSSTIAILDDDTIYSGVISDCKEVTKNERDMAILIIDVVGETLPFEIVCVYEFAHEFVEFLDELEEEINEELKKDLAEDLTEEDEHTLTIEDLIGMQIEFSVVYNRKRPNFTSIYRV